MHDNTNVALGAMQTDDENVRLLPFPVSEALAQKLDEQRERLDNVDSKLVGKQRYQHARQELGCLAAVAKGAKDRELKPDRIYIPGTELQNGNGKVRISSLKATLTVPAEVHVKGLTFIRDNGTWSGVLEVRDLSDQPVPEKALSAAA